MAKSKKRTRPKRKKSVAQLMVSADSELMVGQSARDAGRLRGVIPTGLESVDIAIGRGGLPQGRVSMIQGDEGGGKTTFCLSCCRSVQERGGVAIYADPERKLDLGYAEKVGVDLDELILDHPRTMERFALTLKRSVDRLLDICEEEGEEIPGLIVVDSITALDTFLETSLEDLAGQGKPRKGRKKGEGVAPRVGAQPLAMSVLLRKIVPVLAESPIALLLVSQLRTKLTHWGAQNDSTCGRAPKFYSCLIIQARPESENESGSRVGERVEFYVAKNQIAQPFKSGQYSILGARGLDRERDILDAAVTLDLAERAAKGGWITFSDDTPFKGLKVQGPRGLRVKMRKRPELGDEIRAVIRKTAGWED